MVNTGSDTSQAINWRSLVGKQNKNLVQSHEAVASIAAAYWSRFESIMVGPGMKTDCGYVVCGSMDATGWLISAFSKENPAEAIQVCFLEKTLDVTRCLVEIIAKSGLPVCFSNGTDYTYAFGVHRLCDALADCTWDEIDRNNPDLPDAPEDYAEVADGHPIDELRSDLGDTITYFDGNEEAARQRLLEIGVQVSTAEKYLKIERERS